MASKKQNIQKFNYRIKLLAGNNVILVEADNYESELFTPQIVNDRITLLNIIPNRRCCQVTKNNVMNFAFKEPQESTAYLKEQNGLPAKKDKLGRYSSTSYTQLIAPLANSTPAGVKDKNSYSTSRLATNCYSSIPNNNSTDTSLPSPEPVRRAIPKLLEKSILSLPPGVKVARIYHNSVEGTPKNIGRLVTTNRNLSSKQNSANTSLLSGSFRLPCSPSLTTSKSRRSVVNFSPALPADSIAKWHKVLTPVRTYTKHSKNPIMVRRSASIESAKKALKPVKITPTYLVNPTKGLAVTKEIEIKKRKLIIDRILCISPKTFKRQQKEPVETFKTTPTLLQTNSLSLHKPRQYLDSLPMSAFDLLTNSNRKRCMAAPLNLQFRKGCVNKASSTYSKYKVLSIIPTLKDDEQVLELSRISLAAAGKSAV